MLESTLNDGVVLADLLSFLDPARLPYSSINRGAPRNAMSMPTSNPTAQSPANIDSRQLSLQYKNNTRRVIAAVKKVLDDVRSYSGFPHRPAPGAVDSFLGNVSAVPPSYDLRPSVRLAELVIAIAVYGPRHNEFRHSIWRFPNEATGSAFHMAMSAVSQAVALPPPDVLYAAGPPPPRPVHQVPGVMSPVGHSIPPHVLTSQGRVHSPRPPLSPHPPPSPIPLSPRASSIPNPILNPQHATGSRQSPQQSPQQSHQHRKSPVQSLQNPSPGQGMHQQSGASPSQSSRSRSNRSSPRRSASPQNPASPHIQSPRSGSGSPRNRSPSPMQGRTPRTSSVSTRPSNSPRQSTRVPSTESSPRRSAVAPLTQSNVPDAKAVPMMDDSVQAHTSMYDEGMDGRKLSIVTDDSSTAQDESMRGDAADSSGDLRAVASVARHVVESEIVQSMDDLEHGRQSRKTDRGSHNTGRGRREKGSPHYEGTSEDQDEESKRSSEEFFTPNELSPSSTAPPSSKKGFSKSSTSQAAPRPPPTQEELSSPAMSQIYIDSGTRQIYKDTKVDENVRKSVSTSITGQTSRGSKSRQEPAPESRNTAPQLFRSESTNSSFDFKDQSYLLSPPNSDVPSPSNKWQISLEKGSSQDILSPLPMFSPPAMPVGKNRTAGPSQMILPLSGAPNPPLFRPGTLSPQLSVSSAGGNSASEGADRTDTVPPPIQPKRLSDSSNRGCTQAQAQNRLSTSSTGGLPPRPPKSLSSSSLPLKRSPQPSVPAPVTSNLGKSRVSFAPTIVSPGGHARPLGEPLKSTENTQGRPYATGSNRSSESFSLPPSSGYDENRNTLQGPSYEVSKAKFEQNNQAERHTKRNSGSSYSQQSYHTARSTFEEEEISREQHDHDLPEEFHDLEGDEADESHPFQRVQEYVVYNSDEEKRRLSERQSELREAVDDSDEVEDPSHQLDPHDDVVYDEDEEFEGSGVIDDVSPRDEEDLEPNADEFPDSQLGIHNRGQSMTRADTQSMRIGQSKTEGQTDKSLRERTSAHVPSPEDFITPPVATHMSHRSRRFKEVPETPPSPPNIHTLMQSISKSKLSDVDEVEEEEDLVDDDAPVSTMEPSAGLFQKLIAVWQSADEHGTKPEDLMVASKNRISARDFVREVEMSHLSGMESSSNPSGATENEAEKPPPVVKSERRARPHAMRLPPAVATSNTYLSGPEKRDDHEEGTSLASFSDAFSDEKDRVWSETDRANDGVEWEEAMKGDSQAGLPISPNVNVQAVLGGSEEGGKSTEEGTGTETETGPSDQGPVQRLKSPSTDYEDDSGVATDGHHVKVDRRRLDWLTKELLAARDAISRKELQMTFAETQRMEQEEILLLERQDAESVVGAMKKILAEREHELQTARNRLSVAIQSTPAEDGTEGGSSTVETGKYQRVSVESRSSNVNGGNLEKLIAEEHAKLHQRFDECNAKQAESTQAFSKEMRGLWNEVQRAMLERMTEMTEKRDAELEALRRELANRERLIYELKESSSDLVDQNRAVQAEASELRMEKEKTTHRYELEMAHVTAQVELVNEFSKKLHDNFRETENLRQQVLQYQDKLSHIASTSGVSQRQIKELREAVTSANDECARLRREADLAKKKGMEAVRRAEELEELRYKDAAAHSAGRFPDRQDSGSFVSHEPVRPAGHNRPGGNGVNTRYHGRRGMGGGPGPAQKTWLLIKEKIGGIVTGKEGSSRRRGQGGMRVMGGSQSSRSQTRSRISRDDDMMMARSRSGGSRSSNASESVGGSMRSGGSRSNRSGGGGSMGGSMAESGGRDDGMGDRDGGRSIGSGSIDDIGQPMAHHQHEMHHHGMHNGGRISLDDDYMGRR